MMSLLKNKEVFKDFSFYVYSKKIKEKEIKKKKIDAKGKKKKFFNVVNSLLGIGHTKDSQELHLKEWVLDIISTIPNIEDKDIKTLLSDFTGSMYTQMKMENKYVIAILMEDSLILCHSIIGEKTITPNLQVIERMLDKDNVTRYVCFKKENERIKVIFYEEERSLFLLNG